jgi:hypothetical protein
MTGYVVTCFGDEPRLALFLGLLCQDILELLWMLTCESVDLTSAHSDLWIL